MLRYVRTMLHNNELVQVLTMTPEGTLQRTPLPQDLSGKH